MHRQKELSSLDLKIVRVEASRIFSENIPDFRKNRLAMLSPHCETSRRPLLEVLRARDDSYDSNMLENYFGGGENCKRVELYFSLFSELQEPVQRFKLWTNMFALPGLLQNLSSSILDVL